MSDRLKTVLIGIFVVLAITVSIYIILFMEPKIGDGKKILRVRFSNISGITIGTRVTLAGKAVGEVSSITTIKDARKAPTDELGRVYFYQLTLKVDSSVKVFNTDEINIATTGLLGEKSIAIVPKAAKKGVIPKDITNQIIYADSIEPLENMMHQISSLTERLEGAVDNFDLWFVENQEELTESVKSFAATLKEMNILIDSANKQELICSIKKAIDEFTKNMHLIKNALQEAQNKQMVAKMNVILENIAEASYYINNDGSDILVNINKITKDLADGKGTLGKMIKNDDFYLRMVAILSKVDTLMNDINHYGLLFQYDKHWQRIRTKRANILKSIDTPKEFKRYFENEVDTINTAMERISILAKEKDIYSSKKFQKSFKELLIDVEHLLDSLKLYNEEYTQKLYQLEN